MIEGGCPDSAAEIDTRQTRHHPVAHDKCDVTFLHQSPAKLSVGGLQNLVALGLQQSGVNSASDGIIVNEKNLHGLSVLTGGIERPNHTANLNIVPDRYAMRNSA